MALQFSKRLKKDAAERKSIVELLKHGRLYVYSGSKPATADDAPGGTLLCIYTLAGGAFTAPVAATGTVTITGSGGSVDTVKVGGLAENLLAAAVPWNTDVTTTAAAVAASINSKKNALGIVATSSLGVVTLWAPVDLGADAAGLTVAATSTTLTATPANFSGGTSAVNGLNFQYPSVDGVLSKEATAWQGVVLANGTAGWFRYVAGGSTVDGTADTDIRFDGTCGTSGADLILTSTAFVAAATETITGFAINVGSAS